MKVSVDPRRCEGHGICESTAPDFFTLDEDGYSNIGSDKVVPAGMEREVRTGVESCPVAALRISTS